MRNEVFIERRANERHQRLLNEAALDRRARTAAALGLQPDRIGGSPRHGLSYGAATAVLLLAAVGCRNAFVRGDGATYKR